MENPKWSHEKSYKYRGITGIIHRSRLNKILKIFDKIDIKPNGKLADFGCSNGYVISLLKEKVFNKGRKWAFYGFDYLESLLAQARDRKLQDAEFHNLNLNIIKDTQWGNYFDILTCFETLEHVGSYKNAFINLYNSCKTEGIIIISIPNEKGIPGLIKYLGRKILRRNPYGEFFSSRSEFSYVAHLIFNKPIEEFRTRNIDCWGEHLGFDWRLFGGFINKNYLENSKCKLISKYASFLGFNFIYVFEKSE